MQRMTVEEYRDLMKKSKTKGSKHRNIRIYIYEDGLAAREKDISGHGKVVDRFDSVKEYERWCELKLLERGGKISELKKQQPFLILDGYIDSNGKSVRPSYYVADFTYLEKGQEIVEDAKAIDKATGKPLTTQTFRLKWKMLQSRYPDKVFRIY